MLTARVRNPISLAALNASCCTLGERPDAELDESDNALFLPSRSDASPGLLERCAPPGDDAAAILTLEAPSFEDAESSSDACEPCDCAATSGRAIETLVQGGGYSPEQASAKLLKLGLDVELE